MPTPFLLFGKQNAAMALGLVNTTGDANGDRTGPGSLVSSPATVVVASGGTPGYTYAWSRVSGDSTIACTSPTSASTTFSRSSAIAHTYTAVWKCVVTDSVLATKQITLIVTMVFESGS
jgi:hypothetical protein